MTLKRIHSGPSGSTLYERVTSDGRWLVKVYGGYRATGRRARELATMRLWRQKGFCVPDVLEGLVEGIEQPHLMFSWLPGPTLQEFLRNSRNTLQEKIDAFAEVLRSMRRRHDKALAEGEVALVHPDCNTRNVVLCDDAVFFVDLDHAPKRRDIRDLAATELAKLCRWVIRDMGLQHADSLIGEVLKAYDGRWDLPLRIIRRVKGRPFQFLHRWRDRRRRASAQYAVTKYDVADTLEALMSAAPRA